jgi:energy-coupling factor transporter ATP-binding protein EcfA2
MSVQTNKTYRYPGVKPFSAEEKDWFFGREQDAQELYQLIFVKQLVVLYGKSGFGKSSLVNAGLIPKLTGLKNWEPISIRFKNYSKEDKELFTPLENTWKRVETGASSKSNAIFELLKKVASKEESLWLQIKLRQYESPDEQVLLIFDQFEELFSYPTESIEEFASELADVLYTAIPVRYRVTIERLLEAGEIDEKAHSFLYEKPKVKVLVSIRADRLSLLNGLTRYHSGILQNCYELQALSKAQAREAIVMPAKMEDERLLSPPFVYNESALAKMLEKIMQDAKVEVTSVLQILCRYLEEKKVIELGLTSIGLLDLGEVGNIIKEYYEDILNKILNPDERERARDLIETKLVAGNVRNSLSEAFILDQSKISKETLLTLEETSLLRKERDVQGRLIYEVSHDTLVVPILQMAKVRLEEVEKRKKEELEISFQKEKERVKTLELLNKTVRARSRIAWTVSILAVLISFFAGYQYIKAKRESERAKEAEMITDRERSNAIKALGESERNLNSLKYQKAKELFDNGRLFLDYEEPKLALRSFIQAKQALVNDSVTTSNVNEAMLKDFGLPAEINLTPSSKEFWNEIELFIQKCKSNDN